VPSRLRRLSGHPSLGIQDGNHKGIASSSQTTVEGSDIQQHAIADGGRRHEVGVCERKHF
jgi:hypothetical protein